MCLCRKKRIVCPKCQSRKKIKNGVVREIQRYKCKECSCNYTMGFDECLPEEKKRRFALSLYLEGLGFYSIGRLPEVSHVCGIN